MAHSDAKPVDPYRFLMLVAGLGSSLPHAYQPRLHRHSKDHHVGETSPHQARSTITAAQSQNQIGLATVSVLGVMITYLHILVIVAGSYGAVFVLLEV
jgi:hypothetical protein